LMLIHQCVIEQVLMHIHQVTVTNATYQPIYLLYNSNTRCCDRRGMF
jgi:hypothetical protein